jgi:hypothetical protein
MRIIFTSLNAMELSSSLLNPEEIALQITPPFLSPVGGDM